METWRRLAPSSTVTASRQRRALLALGLCAALAAAASLALARRAPGESGPCASLDPGSTRLERAEPVGYPTGTPAATWLCLSYAPEQDIYGVQLTPVYTPEQFRATKLLAASQLRATGFDPCRVTWWADPAARGTQSLDDLLDNPVACPPRVIAGDPGAEQWLSDVRAAIARVAEASSRDFDWHPARPLTILVVTDPETAIATYKRYGPTGPPDAVARWTDGRIRLLKAGASVFESVSAAGSMILLDLIFKLQWDPSPAAMHASLTRSLAHEYTHFAQHSILGQGAVPAWFEEGQAMYWAHEFMGGTDEYFLPATSLSGTPPRLSQLVHRTDWSIHDALDTELDPHSRGYAAVSYLVDQYGFGTTVQLLHDNRDSDTWYFQNLLRALTGLDMDALHDAAATWLSEPGRIVFRDDFAAPSGHWPAGESPVGRYGYKGQEYALTKLAGSGERAPAFPVLPPYGFDAELDGRVVEPTEGALLGLEFAIPSDGRFYRYLIDPTEHAFMLERKGDTQWEPVIAWQPAIAMNPAGAVNRLGLRATTSGIVLRINGQELAQVDVELTQPVPGAGWLMGIVDQRDDGPAEARFSRLMVANAR
jgi:hypothetical protein